MSDGLIDGLAERFERSVAEHDKRIWADSLREILTASEFNHANPPPEALPVYSLVGIPICTSGNLTAITAAAKAGKSAFEGAMIAAAVTNAENADTLGLRTSNSAGLALVHVDTEQSPSDHWHLVNRALRRGSADAPDWLHSYRLAGNPALKCWELTKLAIADAADLHGGVHSVLLDGLADMVVDVNDPAESNACVAELHGLAITYRCPIIGVLHFNPGSDKVRGHLGSQLERKAETNLTLEKDGEVTAVWSAKNRGAGIPRETGPRFRWCSEAGMHVTADPKDSPKHQEKMERLQAKRDDVFRERGAMRYGDLISTVKKVLTVSDRTAERLVSEWTHYRQIEKAVAGLYAPVS